MNCVFFCRAFRQFLLRARAFHRITRRSKYISWEKCYATHTHTQARVEEALEDIRSNVYVQERRRGGGEREEMAETVTSAHATSRRLYLRAKVHFVQVYNYGFRGRFQFRRTRCWGVASGTPSLPSSLPLRLLEPHQSDQPFAGLVPPLLLCI